MNWIKLREFFGLKYLEAGISFCIVFLIFIPLLNFGLYPRRTKKSRKKILLYGAYGNLSIGDDAILLSILNNLEIEDAEIVVSSFRPEVTSTKTNYTVIPQGRTLDGLFYIHKTLMQSRIIVFGGGGVLETHNNSFRTTMVMVYKLSKVFYAKLLGAKVFCFAIGSNTSRYSSLVKIMVKTLLQVADQVTTRDPNSTKFLSALNRTANIKTLADPALLLRADSEENKAKSKQELRIGINVMPYYKLLNGDKSKLNYIRTEISKSLNYFISKYNALIVFVPMVDEDDTEEQEALMELLKDKSKVISLSPIQTPTELMEQLKGLDVFIGTRLHANILAFNVQIPLIGIAYHPKIQSFFEYIGLKDFQQSIFNIKSSIIIQQFERIINDKSSVNKMMKDKQAYLTPLAQQTFYDLSDIFKSDV